MRKVKLVRAEFKNFQSHKKLSVEFGQLTNIYGRNRCGKSNLIKGINWCITGKNMNDEAKFEVRPQDKFGKMLNEGDVEVSVAYSFDGTEKVFKRIQKLVYRQGDDLEKTVKGTKEQLYIDNVPYAKKKYEVEVSDLFGGMNYKLLTNPLFFNSLKTEDKRSLLYKMATVPSMEDVINALEENSLKTYINQVLNEGKSLDDKKKEVEAKILIKKKDFEGIEYKIQDNIENLPEFEDVKTCEGEIEVLQKELDTLNKLSGTVLLDLEKQETELKAKHEKLKSLENLKTELEIKIERDLTKNKRSLENKKDRLNDELESIKASLESDEKDLKLIREDVVRFKEKQSGLRKQFSRVLAEKFVPSDIEKMENYCSNDDCPYHEKEKSEIHNEESRFNIEKAKSKEAVNKLGISLSEKIKANEAKIEKIKNNQEQLVVFQSQKLDEWKAIVIPEVKVDYSVNKEWNDLIIEIEKLDSASTYKSTKEDIAAEDKERIEKLKDEIKKINDRIGVQNDRKKRNAHLESLQNEKRSISAVVAQLKSQMNHIRLFQKLEMTNVEESVNSMFKVVKFRLFEDNYGEGYKEVCTCLSEGVDFKEVNTEGQVEAGIDIINTLSKHQDLSFPIFIDNRESITEIPETEAQVINLIVDPKAKKLRFETDI